MQVSVQDVMTHQPLTIRHDASLDEALAALLREDAGEIYVVDESSRLLGVLPDYELLKAKLTGTPSSATVETLMSRHFTTVSASTQAAEIAAIFRTGTCRQLAVVEDGRIIGQVSRHDVLRLFAATQQLADEPKPADIDEPSDQRASALRGPRYMQLGRQAQLRLMQD